jgi:rhombotail lipoprotein
MRSISLVVLTLMLVGCASQTEVRRRSDLMSYLYPNVRVAPTPRPGQARLQLPLRLGIAFIPSGDGFPQTFTPGSANSRIDRGPVVSRQDEAKLLDVVRKTFAGKDWVREIVIIPSTYLTPRGGFDNLDQVSLMYGVDVIALASVDQIQYTNQSTLAYLSIVGPILLPLEKNQTRTLIDVAVFHVPSRTFLLRAPGTSEVRSRSTTIDSAEDLRGRASEGLVKATADLSKNLDQEVAGFKASLMAGERKEIQVINQKGVSIASSGSFSLLEAIGALVLSIVFVVGARRCSIVGL